jgi:hypothetical protein
MASTYSGNLAIELIGTGDQAGTWGNTTNTNLGTTLEQAIVGSANVTFTTGTNSAITITQSNAFQAARSLRLNLVGTLAGTQYLYIPAISKQYIINNGLTQSVIVANGANTGVTGTTVTIPAGLSTLVYNDGTNVASVVTNLSNVTISNSTITSATINGGTSNGVTSSNVTIISGTVGNVTVNAYTEGVIAVGNTSNAVTINIANATIVTATLTANCTFTMPGNTAGRSFILLLKTGNGSFTSSFTSVKWVGNTAPTITTANNSMDILTFIADGANWYGNYAQGYKP